MGHWFDAEADQTLRRLEADPGADRILARVRGFLELLERDDGHEPLRRIRFSNGLWCVTVVADADELVILWEPHPMVAGAVIVQYIGPPFA